MECFLHGGELRPIRLIDAQRVTQLTELETILTCVNGFNRCSQNLDTMLVQTHCQVVWCLATNRYNNTCGILELHDVKDSLLAKFLEVQTIRFIKVRGYCFWVAVDDHCLVAECTERLDAGNATPVKLHAAADAIRSATQNHDTRTFWCASHVLNVQAAVAATRQRLRIRNRERNLSTAFEHWRGTTCSQRATPAQTRAQRSIMLFAMVRQVQVVCLCWELCS
mmetsp:Transcript_140291/g.244276  ORF Transcript_140291/g.244276 Transcript_140291/m.244276 type:complete len:223 (+) Transcript_140291:630-1298(+)